MGVDPLALVVDASAGADGAEDLFGGGVHRIGVLDEKLGGEAQVGAAFLEQAGGAGVTIDGPEIVEAILPFDQLGVAPTDEMLFDADAIGTAADEALAGVALELGEVGIVLVVLLDMLLDFRFGFRLDFRRGRGVPRDFSGEERIDGRGDLGCGLAPAAFETLGQRLLFAAAFLFGTLRVWLRGLSFGREYGVRGEGVLRFRWCDGSGRRNDLDDRWRGGDGRRIRGWCGGLLQDLVSSFGGRD